MAGQAPFERFEIFTAMKIRVVVLLVGMPCNDVVGYQRVEGPRCVHIHVSCH